MAEDFNDLGADQKGLRARGRLVAFPILSGVFDKDILNGSAGRGEGPGDVAVMADDHERNAGCGSAGERPGGRVDPGKIPKARKAKAQMRIAGEKRMAGCRAAARHGPFVGSLGWLREGFRKKPDPAKDGLGGGGEHW